MVNQGSYTYYLPDENNKVKPYDTSTNSLIIIGANGSGKSKLGAWMEQQKSEDIHRVGAQRSLNFSEHVPLKSYEESKGEFFYGSSDKSLWDGRKGVRWDWGEATTTKLLDDYDAVLSALLARQRNETQKYFNRCRDAENERQEKPYTPVTPLDQLNEVWSIVFPHRNLTENDSKFVATFIGDSVQQEYSATQMSDGERSVLYLAAQVLCIPENKTIIIDEPEVHLHPSLMNRLWQALEAVRSDCLFVFITHDVQFASNHGTSDKIWVKSYDGNKWKWEFIPDSDLPEQLLLELLGNRKNVLFVEGDKGSYDVQLYSALYPDYYVVSCGGCSQVISNAKAFASTSGLHELKAYGIIDRDYRCDDEIEALKGKGVYSLKVAEVENLFLVEPVLRVLAERFACSDVENVANEVKKYIIDERFANQIEVQVCRATIASLKAQLSAIEIKGNNSASISECFRQTIASLSPDEELEKQNERFRSVLELRDYDEVLKVFNAKGVAKSVGHFFGVNDKLFCSKAVALLEADEDTKLVEALRYYVPKLP